MLDDWKTSLAAYLKFLVLGGAAAFILLYLILALLRISYPYELEWMEGSMVDHVQRILDGKSLYVAPSLDFVPFAYPPLYFQLCAALAHVTGPGFLPLRLLSLMASLGVFALLILLVRRETGKWSYGLLAAGVFAATYRACGAWLDVGRVDSLLVLLLLAAAYVLRSQEGRRGTVVSGVLLALAVLTKQTALFVAVPLLLFVGLVQRERLLWMLLPFLAVAGGVVLTLTVSTDGWFWYYTYVQPSHHAVWLHLVPYVLAHDLLATMGIAAIAAVLWFCASPGRPRLFYGLFTLGMTLATLAPRLKAGGYENNLIPLYAVLSILLGLAAARWAERSRGAKTIVYAACLGQLLLLLYNPARCIPTENDRLDGQRLIRQMAAFPGEILLFSHGYLPTLAGKHSTASSIAISDLLCGGETRAQAQMLSDFRNALQNHRYSAIILDDDDPLGWKEIALSRYYSKTGPMMDSSRVFWPVSGYPTRPEWIYQPREDSLLLPMLEGAVSSAHGI